MLYFIIIVSVSLLAILVSAATPVVSAIGRKRAAMAVARRENLERRANAITELANKRNTRIHENPEDYMLGQAIQSQPQLNGLQRDVDAAVRQVQDATSFSTRVLDNLPQSTHRIARTVLIGILCTIWLAVATSQGVLDNSIMHYLTNGNGLQSITLTMIIVLGLAAPAIAWKMLQVMRSRGSDRDHDRSASKQSEPEMRDEQWGTARRRIATILLIAMFAGMTFLVVSLGAQRAALQFEEPLRQATIELADAKQGADPLLLAAAEQKMKDTQAHAGATSDSYQRLAGSAAIAEGLTGLFVPEGLLLILLGVARIRIARAKRGQVAAEAVLGATRETQMATISQTFDDAGVPQERLRNRHDRRATNELAAAEPQNPGMPGAVPPTGGTPAAGDDPGPQTGHLACLGLSEPDNTEAAGGATPADGTSVDPAPTEPAESWTEGSEDSSGDRWTDVTWDEA